MQNLKDGTTQIILRWKLCFSYIGGSFHSKWCSSETSLKKLNPVKASSDVGKVCIISPENKINFSQFKEIVNF